MSLLSMELLSCPLCLKPHFEGVDELRSSLITVATSQIVCPVCKEVLMGLDKLTIHLFSHITHNLVQESLNESLNEVTTCVENLPRHKNDDSEKQLSRDTPNSPDIKKDMDVESYSHLIEESILTIPKENPKKKTMKCDICNFYFADENILDMHQKLLHQTQVDSKTGQYSYHCHLCSKKFKMRGSLMVHLRVAHYGFTNQDVVGCSSDIQSGETLKNTDKIEKSADGKQWVCDVCSKQFTTKYFLKKHKRLHTGEMPYFCAQCNKSFTFQQSYHKHMLYHSSEKPHLCSECGRAFKELSTLHNHERIHSGERPFVCETCGKSFRQRVSYLVHRRIHTGVMPYKCTACDKSFRYKVSQKSHKCPANPPGSVVRAPTLTETLSARTLEKKPEESPESKNTEPYNLNLYEQQTPGFCDQSSVIKVENEGIVLKHSLEHLILADGMKFDNNMNTIIFNSDGQIIGQNFAFDGQNIVTITPKLITNNCNDPKNSDTSKNNKYENYMETTQDQHEVETSKVQTAYDNNNKSPDFLSMVLSPTMPDVQSLCLSNSPSNDNEDCRDKQPLETINEESFKKLLDGLSNCI